MNAGFLHKDQIYQTHQAMKITAGRLLFCKPESTHSRLTSSRWSLMGPERVAVPFLTHLFIFTRAASLSRLVQYNSFTHNPEFQNKTKKINNIYLLHQCFNENRSTQHEAPQTSNYKNMPLIFSKLDLSLFLCFGSNLNKNLSVLVFV